MKGLKDMLELYCMLGDRRADNNILTDIMRASLLGLCFSATSCLRTVEGWVSSGLQVSLAFKLA